MIDRNRRLRLPPASVLPIALAALVAAACADSPTEPAPGDSVGDLLAAGLAPGEQNPNSNGQTFVAFGGEGFGFGVVEFPSACFVFNQAPGDLPGSWVRAKPGATAAMEHVVITDGFLLVGSFFEGLQGGTGRGTSKARFDNDGIVQSLVTTIHGRLDDGSKVHCRLHVGPDDEVIERYIRIG